jgi:2-polyprenyl-3-methyl-5-hydroxy-6-metoxy-1,4-benzoquinol methylase
MIAADFPICPVCNLAAWTLRYEGPVRDGGFGETRPGQVARCGGCGIERLAESLCLQDEDYRGGTYRTHVGQDHELAHHYGAHDELTRFTLDTVWPKPLRGKVVADVGCGGGSLLDHLRGVTAELIAIDPDEKFASSLRARGYRHFPGSTEAAAEFSGQVDVAFAIQVIEHVADPRDFLAKTRTLLAPDGVLVVSTPNRADILMDLLPDDFPAFFHRTQHRWYFDAASLSRCAQAAGFGVSETRHIHRYGMANALLWLRDRKPSGRAALGAIDRLADDLWRSYLESSGRADNLYMVLRVA